MYLTETILLKNMFRGVARWVLTLTGEDVNPSSDAVIVPSLQELVEAYGGTTVSLQAMLKNPDPMLALVAPTFAAHGPIKRTSEEEYAIKVAATVYQYGENVALAHRDAMDGITALKNWRKARRNIIKTMIRETSRNCDDEALEAAEQLVVSYQKAYDAALDEQVSKKDVTRPEIDARLAQVNDMLPAIPAEEAHEASDDYCGSDCVVMENSRDDVWSAQNILAKSVRALENLVQNRSRVTALQKELDEIEAALVAKEIEDTPEERFRWVCWALVNIDEIKKVAETLR